MGAALRFANDTPQSLAASVRALAPTSTCSEVAGKLGLRVGAVARCALVEGVAFGGVEDKGAWPRRGGPPRSLIPVPSPSTLEIFEHEARTRGVEPLSLAQACLDAIAHGKLFKAVLEQ